MSSSSVIFLQLPIVEWIDLIFPQLPIVEWIDQAVERSWTVGSLQALKEVEDSLRELLV